MDARRKTAPINSGLKPLAACLLLPFATGDLACSSAMAATLQVANCNDPGSGTLREAIALAHTGDSIDLTALTCGTISLATGELQVSVDDLVLRGPGANALKISGNPVTSHSYALIHHTGHGVVRIDALTLADPRATYSGYGPEHARCILSGGSVYLSSSTVTACGGGGVFATDLSMRDSTISLSKQGVYTGGGNVSIIGSTISGNGDGQGYCAGLRIDHQASSPPATVLISNSTISGNKAYNYAGCISGLPTTIRNSTVAFNNSYYTRFPLGGLLLDVPQLTIESSIFANNAAAAGGLDLFITPGRPGVDGHNNLIATVDARTRTALPSDTITADPRLLPLANNGGPTLTHALASGSPAIDAGNNLAGLSNDQRGPPFLRSAGPGTDIGALESQATAANSVPIGPGFTGSWFDPAQSGHGLMLEVLSDHRLLAMWFAFNPEGTQQTWFGGVGTYNDTTATITNVAQPTGGRWIPNFDSDAIVRNPWGTLTLTFTDCNHGRVDFSSVRGYGNGSMDLLRLTQPAGLTCP